MLLHIIEQLKLLPSVDENLNQLTTAVHERTPMLNALKHELNETKTEIERSADKIINLEKELQPKNNEIIALKKHNSYSIFNLVPDDEFGERTVSVLLDGEESEMIFIDHPASEMSLGGQQMRYRMTNPKRTRGQIDINVKWGE
ncbi:hypothetical protein ILUMI_08716 [Ignelater luminosus]|uniref:Uncharacterized protein n=1 Tax=Ignelater luminosus TaxID=2038154 RepID=A0A8K0D747_IGNLU|nr:hypothetical protein ILUMI_08716 [Ignelater luminosus]